ncbi:MAG: primosomal protein N', partial [Planctomycetota bacterium]
EALGPPAVMPEGLTAKELARHAGAKTVGPINKLIALGLLVERRTTHVASRAAAWETLEDRRDLVEHTPTDEQRRAIDAIAGTLGSFAVHLLLGVTGSGKTEVYLSLIRALGDDGTALVLVPEIALTPQTVARFEARLADLGVAVLHSGLAAADRHRQWRLAAEGKVRVVIGTRSAVFAPLANLKLVIVDEEHDHSYKQDQAPRYNARDVAIKRAHLAQCPVLLGSATPSIESWHNATAQLGPGRAQYRLHKLTKRATGASMPTVTIADLARERRHMKADDAIGPTLDRALKETLDAGGQAL